MRGIGEFCKQQMVNKKIKKNKVVVHIIRGYLLDDACKSMYGCIRNKVLLMETDSWITSK